MDRATFLRRTQQVIIIIVLSLGIVEIIGHVFILLLNWKAPALFVSTIPISAEKIKEYSERRDKILGWTHLKEANVDESGSRYIPSFPKVGKECFSVYGDSFAWGEEANEEDAWVNVFSVLRKCRVSNFGVGGYGMDQAYLRFQRNIKDDAKNTILTVYPDDILRNVTSNFGFLNGEINFESQKPHFELNDDNELIYFPLPMNTEEDFKRFSEDPANFFGKDYFGPIGTDRAVKRKISSISTIIELLQSRRIKRQIRALIIGQPSWSEFFSSGHPTKSLEIASKIAGKFELLAKERAKNFLLVMLPDGPSYKYYRKHGKWVYQDFLDELSKNNIRYLNSGIGFEKYLANRSFCELLTETIKCKGHFNKEGYTVLAEVINEAFDQ